MAADSIWPETKGMAPMFRCAAWPVASFHFLDHVAQIVDQGAGARQHHRAQRVGVMPRAERSNSGTPNMLSSSDRALVTAGWLVAICSATRVSDPCCSICSSSIRCRILRREPSFRTTSSGLNEVIYWGHSHGISFYD